MMVRQMNKITKEQSNSLDVGEALNLFYVRLSSVNLWEENPKKHAMGNIIESIQKNGFRDPPAWDEKLKAVIEGNGRIEALQLMEREGYDLPRGILKHKTEGYWCVPVLFGIDSESKDDARRYAIDHNNLTVLGGDFTLYDVAKLWERDGYLDILSSFENSDNFPISVDREDFTILLNMVESGYNGEDSSHLGSDDPSGSSSSDSIGGDGGGSDSGDGGERDRGVVFTIAVGASIFAQDVMNELKVLVDSHPEWEAALDQKKFKGFGE